MLKINSEIFENLIAWKKKRNDTLFKNNLDLEYYQNYYLKKLLESKEKQTPIFLKSSGTTNNISKEYKFPSNFHKIIEYHHIWKIMHVHKINAGNVVRILQTPPEPTWKNTIIGPILLPSMGLKNKTHNFVFNPLIVDDNFWKDIFLKIKNLKPKFLYTTPSVFVSFKNKIKEKFEFPIIFSCETLTDAVRKESNLYFKKTIDKMMDWTTGLGFFECEYGTKHIYDEFCIVKQKEKEILTSISLFNYFDKSEKTSDDTGTLKKKTCLCGIYGNYFEEFKGKIFECLVSIKGVKYSSNSIARMFQGLSFELGIYEILQKKNKSIEFKTKNKLEYYQIEILANILNNIIGDYNENINFSIIQDDNVLLPTNSNLCIKFITENLKIYKNKIIMVRSYAV